MGERSRLGVELIKTMSERRLEVSRGGLAHSSVPAQSLPDRRQRKVSMPCRAVLLQTAVLSGLLLVFWNLVCPQRTISNFSKDVCFAKHLAPGNRVSGYHRDPLGPNC